MVLCCKRDPTGQRVRPYTLSVFVVFINDLPHVVKSVVRIFADDTKLYGSDATEGGRSQIQDGSNSLSDWSDKWLLKFNTCTCSVMHLGRKKPKHKSDTRENDGGLSTA